MENVVTQNQNKCSKFSGFRDGYSANDGNLPGVYTSRSASGFFLRKWINEFCSVTLKMEAERPTETFIRTIVLPTQLSFTALQITIAKYMYCFDVLFAIRLSLDPRKSALAAKVRVILRTYKQTMCDKRYRLDY